MSTILFARGIPASGKTTILKRLYDNDSSQKKAFISKDAIRKALYPAWEYPQTDLYLIEDIRDIAVEQHLDMGYNIVVDETFIEYGDMRRFIEPWAYNKNHQLWCYDLRKVPLELCILRDLDREHPVGTEAIVEAWNRLQAQKLTEMPLVVSMLIPDEGGWLAELQTRRDRYKGVSLSQGSRAPDQPSEVTRSPDNNPLDRVGWGTAISCTASDMAPLDVP